MSQPVTTTGGSAVNSGYGTHSSFGADFDVSLLGPTTPLSPRTVTAPPEAGMHKENTPALEDGTTLADHATSPSTTAAEAPTPSRSNTLRKRDSMRRANSLKRSNSKRSVTAGSLAGLGGPASDQDYNSAYSTPVPTQGAPTEILANRFQAWRQLLKSLITYFREIQASYDLRAKSAEKTQNALAAIVNPPIFMRDHGINEATKILNTYHQRHIAEARKSYAIEEDVIGALSGLRNDLGQKIKEIKSLAADFKNSVDREKDNTTREIGKLQDSIALSEREDGSATGKSDPYVVKLGVDRSIERQIDEENYLHRAYLNLENSGRELESIVVGEIQKAYNAIAGMLKREGDDAHTAVDALRTGPIALPKDAEWTNFVQRDPQFVDPNLPLRRIEDIEYPGKHHPSTAEVRAGMLERKSKYLKSYAPGWYVLSPTHLHEFKSADKIYSQPPVMSLYLPDQRLGSHSQPGSSSHKFMVKGKQSGTMHKGHNWVFRAETYDTMMAWFEDMHVLTEKTGEERNAFVRKHARSFSQSSRRASMSSDGMDEDEADQVPYSADASNLPTPLVEPKPQRPQPGGRFPSDLNIQRARGVSLGQSSASSGPEESAIMTGALDAQLAQADNGEDPYRLDGVTAGTATMTGYDWDGRPRSSYFDQTPVPGAQTVPVANELPDRSNSTVTHDWVAPAATGAVGAAIGAVALKEHEAQDSQATAPDSVVPTTAAEAPEVVPVAAHTALVEPSAPAVTAQVDNTAPSQAGMPPLIPNAAPVDEPAVLATDSDASLNPRVGRQDTSYSISQLPLPGKFPKSG